jgi:hypothetical protein
MESRMIFKKNKYIIFLVFIVAFSCKKKLENKQIIIDNNTPYSKYVTVIQRVGVGEKAAKKDTFIVKEQQTNFIITLPTDEEQLYDIGLAHGSLFIPFITDTKAPKIIFDNSIPELYKLENSPASIALYKLNNKQKEFAEKSKTYYDSIKQNKDVRTKQLLQQKVLDMDKERQAWLEEYASNATNPFVFLVAYQSIEFGNRFADLKRMMQNAQSKFKEHTGVQSLVKKTVSYLKIFEEEYEIGTRLPEVNTNMISIAAPSYSASEYTLVDFWATWYTPSLFYLQPKKVLRSMYPAYQLQINSIALDMDRTIWNNFVQVNQLSWNNYVDTAVWEGPTTRLFKFDSMPFNFLVNKQGIIVAKAIPPDSLIPVIKHYFNK